MDGPFVLPGDKAPGTGEKRKRAVSLPVPKCAQAACWLLC